MAKSQKCHINLICENNGTYTSPDLVFTKLLEQKAASTKAVPEVTNVKMATLQRIRKRTTANKRSIGKLERRIKHVEDINKLTVRKVNAQLRQQLLLNAELSEKISDLHSK